MVVSGARRSWATPAASRAVSCSRDRSRATSAESAFARRPVATAPIISTSDSATAAAAAEAGRGRAVAASAIAAADTTASTVMRSSVNEEGRGVPMSCNGVPPECLRFAATLGRMRIHHIGVFPYVVGAEPCLAGAGT